MTALQNMNSQMGRPRIPISGLELEKLQKPLFFNGLWISRFAP
jgi:hypothetical protein